MSSEGTKGARVWDCFKRISSRGVPIVPGGSALGENRVVCLKKGLVDPAFHCRAFQYDPLKRTPPKPVKVDFSRLKEEDFSL